ncbi:MAG: hypothetical protein QGG73_01690, partial [Candidatus Hydrogenedentes bacterium]|nr:hypothetical protein [Candidatus Hydrogenedentota bacterium]
EDDSSKWEIRVHVSGRILHIPNSVPRRAGRDLNDNAAHKQHPERPARSRLALESPQAYTWYPRMTWPEPYRQRGGP